MSARKLSVKIPINISHNADCHCDKCQNAYCLDWLVIFRVAFSRMLSFLVALC
jgi:hypothetical protein